MSNLKLKPTTRRFEYHTKPTPHDHLSDEFNYLDLRPYSHSILSAANMCPTWGVVHYGLRKRYESDARAMALEYGAAAHEVFAAIYLWQVGFIQNLPDHMHFHARRIFKSPDRFTKALKTIDSDPSDKDRLISLGFNILHTSDFYDDPYDNIRTVGNLELGIIKYVENVVNDMTRWPIYISDPNDPTKPIGVEFSVDYIIERSENFTVKFEGKPVESIILRTMRYIGQIDRIHEIERDGKKHLVLGENKTGARLDTAWSLALDMSHQITGYLLGLYTMLGRECFQSRVHGLKSKQTGHSEDFNPVQPQTRSIEMFEAFMDWAIDAKTTYETYAEDFEKAPRYTHSCNRYFRPCSLISFCCDTREGRIEQLNQMVESELSPSEQSVMDRIGGLE